MRDLALFCPNFSKIWLRLPDRSELTPESAQAVRACTRASLAALNAASAARAFTPRSGKCRSPGSSRNPGYPRLPEAPVSRSFRGFRFPEIPGTRVRRSEPLGCPVCLTIVSDPSCGTSCPTPPDIHFRDSGRHSVAQSFLGRGSEFREGCVPLSSRGRLLFRCQESCHRNGGGQQLNLCANRGICVHYEEARNGLGTAQMGPQTGLLSGVRACRSGE